MKKIFKKIVIGILEWEARLILKKYKPKLIGVTGSVGKTSTKEVIATVLSGHFKLRKSEKSYNSELGIPLTIIGAGSAWGDIFGWLEIIAQGLSLICFKHDYPEWLVLEIGADRPGDIRRACRWLKFEVAVLTHLPEIPVHIEFFKSKEELIEEKFCLIENLSPGAIAILNFDDPIIRSLRPRVGAKVLSYGFDSGADLQASNDHLFFDDKEGKKILGRTFKVDYQGQSWPFRLSGILAHHQVGMVLAALAVGLSRGLNVVQVADNLTQIKPMPGRLSPLLGIKETLIIDDAYNSSPAALSAGLDLVKEVEIAGRKIVVLGDMMELGGKTVEAHRLAGEQIAKCADFLVTVGMRAKFFVEGAKEAGMSDKKIKSFDEAKEAGNFLQNFVEKNDLIYFKGSQSIRLERAVEEIMLEPEKKSSLLVRQESEWLKR